MFFVYLKKISSLISFLFLYGCCPVAQELFHEMESDVSLKESVRHQTFVSLDNKYRIHVLSFGKGVVTPCLVHAVNGICSREEVCHIVKRVGAFAACNGGHYRRGGPFNGCSLGRLFIQSEDQSLATDPYLPHPLIAWNAGAQEIFFDRLQFSNFLVIGADSFPVHRLNQPCGDDEAVLYDCSFDVLGTRTMPGGYELILEKIGDNQYKIKDGSSAGNSSGGAFIYSCGPQFAGLEQLKKIAVGVECHFNLLVKSLEGSEESVIKKIIGSSFQLGAGPLLITKGIVRSDLHAQMIGGKIIPTYGDEASVDFADEKQRAWFIDKAHPRTAFGVTTTGAVLVVAVESLDALTREGMTLADLATFMKQKLDCSEAINLGGGGCTTLCIKDRVVTQGSGSSSGVAKNQQRPVSEALVFMLAEEL